MKLETIRTFPTVDHAAKPETAKLDLYAAVAIAEGFDDQEHTEAETIEAWQYLIDCGAAWTLQGFFGRQAAALIDAGICSAPE